MRDAADRRRPQPARPGAVARAGFAYEGIGRPRRPSRAQPEAARGSRSTQPDGGAPPRRRQGRAARRRRRGRPKPLVPIGGLPLAAYEVARSPPPASTRVIVALRRRDGRRSRDALAGSAPRSSRSASRSRSGAAAACASRPGRGSEGRVWPERRRAPRPRPRGAARRATGTGAAATIVVAPLARRSASSSSDDAASTGFREAPVLRTGSTPASTCSTTRRSRGCPSAATTRTHLPRARRRGRAPRVPARGRLADGEHAEGSPVCSQHYVREHPDGRPRPQCRMTVDSPNFEARADEWRRSRPVRLRRRREAVGARSSSGRHTDATAGKILFVRAGEALSLQFPDAKDES